MTNISTIVIGVDGSEGSRRSTEFAATLAAQLKARVIAVHVFEPLAHIADMAPPYHFDEVEARARVEAETTWTMPLRTAGVSFETRVLHGTPFDCIADTARETDADVIVVGARGFSTLRGLALGSTSNKLVHAAHRPVLVVPHP